MRRFALPHREQLLGLPIGQHISLKADTADGSMLLRPYTPVTDHNQRGLVDFVIKVGPQPRMSSHLEMLLFFGTWATWCSAAWC